MGITLRPFTNMIITVVTLADMATTMDGYGNSDRYRGGPIDGISTEAFRDGRKGYCRIDSPTFGYATKGNCRPPSRRRKALHCACGSKADGAYGIGISDLQPPVVNPSDWFCFIEPL